MPGVEWRQIGNWPNYEVSENGDVRRAVAIRASARHSLVKTFVRSGYLSVSLCYGKGTQKAKKFLVHRLVAEAFLGPRPSPNHQVAHNDGRRMSNHFSNLRWATRSENEQDKKLHGVCPKLNRSDVIEIRTKFAVAKTKEIAKTFEIDPSYASKVRRGLFWK